AAPATYLPLAVTPCPACGWLTRAELHKTDAHAYCGPLAPERVLASLATGTLSEHARSVLARTFCGELMSFYFHGLSPCAIRTPSTKRVPVTSSTAESLTAASSGLPADEGSGSASFAEDTALGGVLALLQAAESTRERWRCRLCHRYLHVPASSVANLGAHLFGSRNPSKAGCLDMRADSPSEPVPPPARDASGALVHIGPDSAVPSSRASRLPRD
ncbi:hypothetical protein V8E36_001470, partial [Tilletia maclaganii]